MALKDLDIPARAELDKVFRLRFKSLKTDHRPTLRLLEGVLDEDRLSLRVRYAWQNLAGDPPICHISVKPTGQPLQMNLRIAGEVCGDE